MKNKSILAKEEKDLLGKIGLHYDYSSKLSDEQVAEIEDKVGDYLTLSCLDKSYKPNREGEICYRILSKVDML
ncbi:MAG: hypothetical protein SOW18_01475 [Peptoniphilus sp.]|nr:hypothetical protein [Peptoniphilus sp.]MDY3118189.1 hypothetical protein [Peptoniphilus sp.]